MLSRDELDQGVRQGRCHREPRSASIMTALPSPTEAPKLLPPPSQRCPVVAAGLTFAKPATDKATAVVAPLPLSRQSEPAPITPVARPDLDIQIRAILARSGDALQQQRAERQAFDERVVTVLRLMTELETQRGLADERFALIEQRLATMEAMCSETSELSMSRTEQFDQRMARLERSMTNRLAHRSAV